MPSAVVDETNERLIVAVTLGTSSGTLVLYRCNLVGALACNYTSLWYSTPLHSARTVDAAIDGQQLVIATLSSTFGIGLYRCNLALLKASACNATDLTSQAVPSTGGINNGLDPQLALYSGTARVVSTHMGNSNKVSLLVQQVVSAVSSCSSTYTYSPPLVLSSSSSA